MQLLGKDVVQCATSTDLESLSLIRLFHNVFVDFEAFCKGPTYHDERHMTDVHFHFEREVMRMSLFSHLVATISQGPEVPGQ
jgi:hypothetical protein